MSEEPAEEDLPIEGYTIEKIGQQLDAGHITFTIEEILCDVQRQLNENMQAMRRLLPYLSGLYYADKQRRYAEQELFRLQTERTELEAAVHNALAMAPDVLYRVDAISYI